MSDQITKYLPGEIQKAESGGYDASFVMSSSVPDRMKDTFDTKAYQNVVGQKLIGLWQHKTDQPIGHWENIRMVGKKLVGDISIADTNLGQMIKALIAHGTPLMASVGFAPKDYDANDDGGLHFKEVDWLECSVVSVGAHQDAVMRVAKEFGVDFRPSEVDPMVESDPASLPTETIQKAKSAILRANKILR